MTPSLSTALSPLLRRLGCRAGASFGRAGAAAGAGGAGGGARGPGAAGSGAGAVVRESRSGLAAGFDKEALAVRGLGRLGFGFVETGTVTLAAAAGQSGAAGVPVAGGWGGDQPVWAEQPRARILCGAAGAAAEAPGAGRGCQCGDQQGGRGPGAGLRGHGGGGGAARGLRGDQREFAEHAGAARPAGGAAFAGDPRGDRGEPAAAARPSAAGQGGAGAGRGGAGGGGGGVCGAWRGGAGGEQHDHGAGRAARRRRGARRAGSRAHRCAGLPRRWWRGRIGSRRGRLEIVGCGGVATGEHALEKIRAGARLVQLYTAFAYDGPAIVGRIKRELAAALRREGFASVGDAVGTSS